jgi:hypothetical protein
MPEDRIYEDLGHPRPGAGIFEYGRAVVLNWGQQVPKKHLAMSRDIFVTNAGGYLVGGGRKCCHASYRSQGSPTTKHYWSTFSVLLRLISH